MAYKLPANSKVLLSILSNKLQVHLPLLNANALKRFKSDSDDCPQHVQVEESHRFMVDCFEAVKVCPEDAITMADHLVEADKRGFTTHGLARVPLYIDGVCTKIMCTNLKPEILNETKATAWVNGNNCLGPVVGKYSMDIAIAKAKENGLGWVCAKESHHYGISGYYVLMALKENLIGISATNSTPLMVPTCAKKTALGTNPIALGASTVDCNRILLDAASTTVAVGKIEQKHLNKQTMPADWAVDSKFEPTTDPAKALKARALLPAGGYKGYCMAAMVDVLTGVLSGSNYSLKIPEWKEGKVANLGHLFVALDPCAFAPNFDERLDDFLGMLRGSPSIKKDQTISVAGDNEDNNVSMSEENGIPYSANLIKKSNELAKQLGVDPLCVSN